MMAIAEDLTDVSLTVSRVTGVRLQSPDLLLLQGGAVGVDLKAEGFGGEVAELAVDEADGPAALLLVLGDDVAAAVQLASVVVVHAVHDGVVVGELSAN